MYVAACGVYSKAVPTTYIHTTFLLLASLTFGVEGESIYSANETCILHVELLARLQSRISSYIYIYGTCIYVYTLRACSPCRPNMQVRVNMSMSMYIHGYIYARVFRKR